MQKQCFKCKITKPLEDFYKHPAMSDGRVGKCKECNKSDVRKNYADNIDEKKEYDKYRHRHSIPRLFSHKYSMIVSRCTKVHITNGIKKSVFGKSYLSKEEWLKWCYDEDNYKKFIEIYNIWTQSNFDRKLTPSIDRIDNKKGYIIGNIQWLTLSENVTKYTK